VQVVNFLGSLLFGIYFVEVAVSRCSPDNFMLIEALALDSEVPLFGVSLCPGLSGFVEVHRDPNTSWQTSHNCP